MHSPIESCVDSEILSAFRCSLSIDSEIHIFPVSGLNDIRWRSNKASWLAHKSKPLFASIRSSLEDSDHSLMWLARNTDVVEILQRLQWWRSRRSSLRKEPCETRVFTILSISVPAFGVLLRVFCNAIVLASSYMTSFEMIWCCNWIANAELYEGFSTAKFILWEPCVSVIEYRWLHNSEGMSLAKAIQALQSWHLNKKYP